MNVRKVEAKMPLPICFVDGKVCTGKFVAGAPSCDVSVFSDGHGNKTVSRCPRLK
jgi:hypothetical protein